MDNLRYSGLLDYGQIHDDDRFELKRLAPSTSTPTNLVTSGVRNEGPERREAVLQPLNPQASIYTSGTAM